MKSSKTREMLKEQYLNCLKEGRIPWQAVWKKLNLYNGFSNHQYTGINKMLLQYMSNQRGYEDPRFFTFNQVKDMGLHLNETAKGNGIPIEFWSLYDKKEKKTITLGDFERIKAEEPERIPDIKWMVKNYHVFNGIHIEGLPELELTSEIELEESDHKLFVDTLVNNMGVTLLEKKLNDKAYYVPSEDTVVLPSYNSFFTDEDYYAVVLHELAHATGHESRLNRNITNVFGSVEYAKEELRAEISSSFVNSELGIVSETVMDNHKAYIQAWIQIIEEQEKELFSAINDAEKIAEYMEEKGQLEKIVDLYKEVEDKKSLPSLKNTVNHTKDKVKTMNKAISEKKIQKSAVGVER